MKLMKKANNIDSWEKEIFMKDDNDLEGIMAWKNVNSSHIIRFCVWIEKRTQSGDWEVLFYV